MAGALIFDLDNCLAPSREVGEELFEPAFAAIRAANRGSVSEQALAQAFADIWRHSLDRVAERYGFSGEMLAAGWRVFAGLEVDRPMSGYADLPVLAELSAQRFLVTSGFRRLQESKIRALGLAPLFTAIHVDAIDEPGRLGKQEIFARILARHHFAAAEVFVVGDSAEAEIEAGNRLGMPTVQTLRPGVPRADNARFHIDSLAQLKKLLGELPGRRA